MRHLVVKRVTALFGGGLLLAAGAFAWLVRGDRATPAAAPSVSAAGAALYQRYCASCHPDEEPLRRALREGGADTRAAFEALLLGHGRASEEDDRVILDYLSAP